MLKHTLIAAAAAALLAGNAFAAPKGMGGHEGVSPSNGIHAIDRDKGLDRAMDRRNDSVSRVSPSNGINAIDRDKGLDRAMDRRHTTWTNGKHVAKRPARTIHRVTSREERMEQARLSWERRR